MAHIMAEALQITSGMEDTHVENWGKALAAGLAGALALTGIHQLAQKLTAKAPRMDVLGERAIVRSAEAVGAPIPVEPSLYRMALAGDIVANSAYYSMIACGRDPRIWTRAVTMGVAAGVGALALPRHLGLGDPPHSSSGANRIMTVAWYLVGALTTAATAEYLLNES